jgi:peptide/nickel transport system permease protein
MSEHTTDPTGFLAADAVTPMTVTPEDVPAIPGSGVVPGEAGHATPGPWRRTARRFRKDKVAMVALGFLVLLMLVAIFAPLVARHDPNQQGIGRPYAGPAGDHWFGTDKLGRDVFSRIVYGARVSLRTGLQIIITALIFAIPIGLFAGYRGGRTDNFVMRIMDALSSIPFLIAALAVVGVLGPGIDKVAIALSIVFIPGFVRLIRAQSLAVREETYIEASHSLGTHTSTLLFKRVLPNVASPLIVTVTLATGAALVAEAGLSLLGFGIQPPDASWGSMIQSGYEVIYTHPWQVLVPGFVLAITVLCFNTVGDALRDALGMGQQKVKGFKARLGVTSVKRDAAPEPRASQNGAGPASQNGAGTALEVDGLTVQFLTDAGPVTVVDHVGFSIAAGEVLGLVGESGSGKTVSSLSIMRLVPSPPGQIIDGSITLAGRDLLSLSQKEMRDVRGAEVAMVFQDPMTSLNPAYTIGNLLVEAIRAHNDLSRAQARTRAEELLTLVGMPDPKRRLKDYPHQLSGGMRQRALLAIALAGSPKVLIADEPTTALDVTVQAQILDLIRTLQRDTGMSVLFVTHDLGVIADLCDRVVVMYAGQIVEEASIHDLFERPRHPYTEGLLGAIPQVAGAEERLTSIPGVVPSPTEFPSGCRFEPRCPYAVPACRQPVALVPRAGRLVRCIRAEELDLVGAKEHVQ